MFQASGISVAYSAGELLALALLCVHVGAQQAVPYVPGVDQSPTKPADYGKCTEKIDISQRTGPTQSHWCKFGTLGSFPDLPNAKAQQGLKFGRQTCYRGPIFGSTPDHRGACNSVLVGSNTHASVAVSTKYLNFQQGGWDTDKGACGKCMCISIFGGDSKYNIGLRESVVHSVKGVSFLGRVIDRCGECADDSIDLLQDRPYAWAPYVPNDNPSAKKVNTITGYRIFNGTRGVVTPEAVGTWTALWQWVPCKWSHAKCASFIASYGYKTRVPYYWKGREYP